MIPLYHLEGQKIAIYGLARSGLAAARAAREGGAEVVVYDGSESKVQLALGEGFEFADLSRERDWEGVQKLIVSPGIPHLYPKISPIIEKAYRKGIVVDNDVSLFFTELREGYLDMETPPRVIAITGSNGKSTSTALCHHALKSLGKRVQMGGNIGRGVLDLDPPREGKIFVIELSSYQTELALTLSPDIAIFTNLSPDHLDRHGGMGGYFAAKSRLFTQSLPRSVIGVDEDEGLFLETHLSGLGARVNAVSLGAKPEGRAHFFHVKKGHLSEWRKGRQAASIDLRAISGLPGQHNWQNAACVFAALRALNLPPKDIEGAFQSFPGLAHRCQIIADIDGVRFVNDSKATNSDAAAQALSAFENIRWIAGGRAKEGGIAPLEEYFPKITKSYLIGEAAEDFSKSLGENPHELSGDLETALRTIKNDAKSGETVLLSPAAASFDQYEDFEKRGEEFISLVKTIFNV